MEEGLAKILALAALKKGGGGGGGSVNSVNGKTGNVTLTAADFDIYRVVYTVNLDTNTCTCNKTANEIFTAMQSGKSVEAALVDVDSGYTIAHLSSVLSGGAILIWSAHGYSTNHAKLYVLYHIVANNAASIQVIDLKNTPAELGFGYATCDTYAASEATIIKYELSEGGIVAIKFNRDVPAGATLNISSTGAKAIYYRGLPITNGVIKADDTVTFIYSTYYHVLSIDHEAPVKSVNGRTGYVDLDDTYLGLTDTLAFETLLNSTEAVAIPIVLSNQNTVMIPDGDLGPEWIRGMVVSNRKVLFGTVVSDGNNGFEPDGRVFEIDSQGSGTTGQLDLHCIKDGILYQITMNYGTRYTGTITETNLAQTEVTVSDAGAVTQECADNTIYTFTGALTSLTLTQATGAREYVIIFTTGSTAPTVTFPSGVVFPDTLTIEANKRYEVSVRDGYAVAQSWAVSR